MLVIGGPAPKKASQVTIGGLDGAPKFFERWAPAEGGPKKELNMVAPRPRGARHRRAPGEEEFAIGAPPAKKEFVIGGPAPTKDEAKPAPSPRRWRRNLRR